MRRKTMLRLGGALITLFALFGVWVMLLPYFWMVSSSIKTGI